MDMIYEINANLLEYPLDGIIHQANCMCCFGGGIAAQIKRKYPELYEADINYGRAGDISKLGSFSTVKCHDGKQGYNLYGQYGYGVDRRQTNYEAVYTGLVGIAQHAIQGNVMRLGLPKNMGSCLGGGNWLIIKSIIDVVFDTDSGIDLYICNYEG
jgi:O-acetyl-ADP-ribose deacetylase (regulator of RNase III)